MACTLQNTSVDAARDYKDSVVYTYQADLGTVVVNPLTALAMAQSMGPTPVPARRAALAGSFLFANNIRGERTSNRQVWQFDVTFGPPPEGEDEDQQNENPLLRPPVFGIDYQDTEYVVKQARNVDDFVCVNGQRRPPLTLGAIHNTAFKRPDEPILRTRRLPVITIAKNYADLGAIMSLNENYQDTTNSDSITLGTHTFVARRLKYELTREGGKQIENGITFFPGVTEISINKTTDLVLDNVGFDYAVVPAVGNDFAFHQRAKDADGEDSAEPVNLKMDGSLAGSGVIGGDAAIQITFRDLAPVAYSSFFS
jgi:hypothetical protein